MQYSIKNILLISLGLFLIALGVVAIINRFEYIETNASDLYQDYVGAKLYLYHQSIYSDSSHPLNHPPFVVFITLPSQLFSFKLMSIISSVLTIVLYFVSMILVYKGLNLHIPKIYFPIILGFALCWYPFQAHIALGQWSIFLGFCLILGWFCLRQDKDFFAGFLFGFACLIKLFPGLIVLFLIFFRRWKAFYAMLFTIVIGFIVSTLVIGQDDVILFFSRIISKNSTEFMAFPINNSILGFLGKFFYNGNWVQPLIASPIPIKILAVLLDIGLVIFLIKSLHQPTPSQFHWDVKFAYVILAMFFISPITWQHMLPMLLLPFGLIISKLNKYNARRLNLLFLASVILFSIPDIQIAQIFMDLSSPFRIPWYLASIFLSIDIGLIIIWFMLNTYGKWELTPDRE